MAAIKEMVGSQMQKCFFPVNKGKPRVVCYPHVKYCLDACAEIFGLNKDLVYAISWKESHFNGDLRRYEPGFYSQYLEGKTKAQLKGFWPTQESEATERHGRATSWGVMQVLGQTARELGFEGHLVALSDPEVGAYWGCMYLEKKITALGTELGIRAFNGSIKDKRTEEYLLGIESILKLKPYQPFL